ncbi:hypothetical protein [Solibaculum mannosilyticum]|uniref:hypothetical protein n=1 Tax=Solibaculum mannosilyticum TaxID=2780922 RepID=UPI0034B4E0D3
MDLDEQRSSKPLYIICIAFGIGFGIYCAPAALTTWNKYIGVISPSLNVMRIMLAILGLIVGCFIAYKLRNRYCTSSIGGVYLSLSVLLTLVAMIFAIVILILVVYLFIGALVFAVLLLAFLAYSIHNWVYGKD